MYFPYLYGRREELLALRDLAEELSRWNCVIPVIEPVKPDPDDLCRCIQQMGDAGASVHLVVNPSHGDFESTDVLSRWKSRVDDILSSNSHVVPTYQISRPADVNNVDNFLAETEGNAIGIVVRSADLDPERLNSIVRSRDVVVFVHSSANPRSYLRVLPKDKAVLVEPCFNLQPRNADYEGEEWFTSSHLDFEREGRRGFSDFGPLPNTFNEGGGQPGAVALHLSYQRPDGSIWLQHFVSDSVERGDGDASSKMSEATAKLHASYINFPQKFVESRGLLKFLQQHGDESPTSLGTSKRQQLVHHITTVAHAMGV